MDVDVKFPSPTPFLTRSPIVSSNPPPNPPTRKTSKHAPGLSKKSALKTHTVQDGVIAKPKQSKSRNGCLTCKKKRLKCDETKPICHQCQKRSVTCDGYKKDFKWRSFEETSFITKSASKPRKASTSSPQLLKSSLQQYPSQKSPSEHSVSTLNADDDFHNPGFSPTNYDVSEQGQFLPYSHPSPSLQTNSIPLSQPMEPVSPGFSLPFGQSINGLPAQHLHTSAPPPVISPVSDSELRHSRFSSKSPPQLIDILLPGTDLNQRPDPAEPRPAQSPLPYQPAGQAMNPPGLDINFDEDFDEEIPRYLSSNHEDTSNTTSNRWSRRAASLTLSDSSSSSDSSNLAFYIQPHMRATSSEMLLARFDQQTCGILSVKDGALENPWRTLVWPLAQDSAPLRHAIFSMSALHGSKANPELLVEGVAHLNKSLEGLVADLNNMHVDAALATTLALAFGDSWDEHAKTGIQHLRGSRHYVRNAIGNHKALVRTGVPDPNSTERLRFLCNTYVYMDVLARLTSLEETDHEVDEGYFENILSTVNGPLDTVNEVDPLLGCAYTLFPLIGRVANLVQKVRKTDSNSITLVSHATELKQLVEQWVVPNTMLFFRPEDPTSEVEHSIHTAEAYRWATLLYLHQAVPEVSSETAHVLAQRILMFLVRVPLSSRATIVQIFPLLAASCEMVSEDDRACARQRWQAMIGRLQIRNVHKCLEVVEEVWRRRDRFESQRRPPTRNGSATIPMMSSTTGFGKRKAATLDALDDDIFARAYDGSDNIAGSSRGPNAKRRVTMDYMGRPVPLNIKPMEMRSVHIPTLARRPSDMLLQTVEPEYTIRGGLHWLGVMRDNGWEVLLG